MPIFWDIFRTDRSLKLFAKIMALSSFVLGSQWWKLGNMKHVCKFFSRSIWKRGWIFCVIEKENYKKNLTWSVLKMFCVLLYNHHNDYLSGKRMFYPCLKYWFTFIWKLDDWLRGVERKKNVVQVTAALSVNWRSFL